MIKVRCKLTKKLRLIITDHCNKKCNGCCNNDCVIDDLPVEKYFHNYDEIHIAGGEVLKKYCPDENYKKI